MEQHEGHQHAAHQHGGTQAGSDGAGHAGTLDLGGELADQLRWHWENQARPRLDGLTDEEYLGVRNAAHFGGPPVNYEDFAYPGTAAEALGLLDGYYATWIGAVSAMDEAALAAPVGAAERHWADAPMATLTLHINREMIHHLAEVALLRDLYAHRPLSG